MVAPPTLASEPVVTQSGRHVKLSKKAQALVGESHSPENTAFTTKRRQNQKEAELTAATRVTASGVKQTTKDVVATTSVAEPPGVTNGVVLYTPCTAVYLTPDRVFKLDSVPPPPGSKCLACGQVVPPAVASLRPDGSGSKSSVGPASQLQRNEVEGSISTDQSARIRTVPSDPLSIPSDDMHPEASSVVARHEHSGALQPESCATMYLPTNGRPPLYSVILRRVHLW